MKIERCNMKNKKLRRGVVEFYTDSSLPKTENRST